MHRAHSVQRGTRGRALEHSTRPHSVRRTTSRSSKAATALRQEPVTEPSVRTQRCATERATVNIPSRRLELSTVLAISDAASLCNCSVKTLTRDAQQGRLNVEVRDGRRTVTVEQLVAAGRYELDAVPPNVVREREELFSRIGDLESALADVRAENQHLADLLNRERHFCTELSRALDVIAQTVSGSTLLGGR